MQIAIICLLLCGVGWAIQLPKGALNERPEKNWAILIAGSNGWGNYRHQADVAHAYHIMVENGIPKNQIITMMYDDIAYNPGNPFPGKIFNNYEHKDYYAGIQIDYKGLNISYTTIEKVMLGDPEMKAQGLKVLESGPSDNVFLYFSDHGGFGLVVLPNGLIYAQQLNKILRTMYGKKMYNQMVLYIEACHAGSMFSLAPPKGINVYATTAANPHESSWAYYCGDKDIHTCLGDEYSITWMRDTSTHDAKTRTLNEQYIDVKANVTLSHVCQYGNLSIAKYPTGYFQGSGTYKRKLTDGRTIKLEDEHRIAADRAHIHTHFRSVMESKTDYHRKLAERKLHRSIQLATFVDQIFEDLSADVKTRLPIVHKDVSVEQRLDCFKTVFDNFQAHCFKIQQVPELMQHLETLHDMCQTGYEPDQLVQSVLHVCT